MGKMKEHPRYNVLSLRVSDYELREVTEHIKGSRQDYLLQALMEKITRDRQASFDDHLKQHSPPLKLRGGREGLASQPSSREGL